MTGDERAEAIEFQPTPLTGVRGDGDSNRSDACSAVSTHSPHRSEGRLHDYMGAHKAEWVSTHSPHRSEGRRPPAAVDRIERVSTHSPHRSEGRPACPRSASTRPSGFNPLPSPE